MSIVRVALDVPIPELFDYSAEQALAPGTRVVVPFGSRTRVGVVVETVAESSIPLGRIRPITQVLTDTPSLAPDWIALARFTARYYQRPLGEVILNALPPRLRRPKLLAESGASPNGIALTETGASAPMRGTVRTSILATLRARQPQLRQHLEALGATGASVIRALLHDGLVAEVVMDESAQCELSTPAIIPSPPWDGPTLTDAQQSAVQAVDASRGAFNAHVLFGVTGSGKTEVYLHLARTTLARGESVLVLVPEISLTPQLEQIFISRFSKQAVAVMHSARAEGERASAWIAAQNGVSRLILGTRLAVFAPLQKIGLIIVDEEHDPSLKQQDGVRYSARDLAVFRAREAACPIVLGSATPSLETYSNACAGRYRLLRLPERARAGALLPTIRTVDMRTPSAMQADGLSPVAIAALGERLRRQEQSLVFLNRRGYAPVLGCSACGWVADCERCAAHLVVHLAERRLRCHHCGYGGGVPRACPSCGNVDLTPFGRGTQRLEVALQKLFPEARILRIDSDTTRARGRFTEMIESIHAGSVDILLGTQILAKGHDFPKLTLVVTLNTDAALMAADYRAPERLFAQLQQVAGRAGRASLPGEVLIQTRYPDHPLFRSLISGDYLGFADRQLAEREGAGFPPAISEAVLRAESLEIADAITHLGQAVQLAPQDDLITIYDPVPMSLARLAGWSRAHVLVQSPERRTLQAFLAEWSARLYAARSPRGVRWHIDVDPLEF
jgi:primosomal protein N' (replication factor Y) (superfamily II helicase)